MAVSKEQLTEAMEKVTLNELMTNPELGNGGPFRKIIGIIRSDLKAFQKQTLDELTSSYKDTGQTITTEKLAEFQAQVQEQSTDRLAKYRNLLVSSYSNAPMPDLQLKAVMQSAAEGVMASAFSFNFSTIVGTVIDKLQSGIGAILMQFPEVQKTLGTYSNWGLSQVASLWDKKQKALSFEEAEKLAEQGMLQSQLIAAAKKIGFKEEHQLSAFEEMASITEKDVIALRDTQPYIAPSQSKTAADANHKNKDGIEAEEQKPEKITSFKDLDSDGNGALNSTELDGLNTTGANGVKDDRLYIHELPRELQTQFREMLERRTPKEKETALDYLDLGGLQTPGIPLKEFDKTDKSVTVSP